MTTFIISQKRRKEVGRGKCAFRELEEARAEARAKLWGSPTARVLIYEVDGEVDEFAWPPVVHRLNAFLREAAKRDGVRLRVAAPSPVKYVETVRHTEERIIELVEEQLGRSS